MLYRCFLNYTLIMKQNIEEIRMMFGTNPNSIDEDLLKERKEVIQLHYDKASKMMTVWSATFIGSTALMVAFKGKSLFWFWFFLLTALISLPWTWYRNVRMIKCFNTVIKKIKKEEEK